MNQGPRLISVLASGYKGGIIRSSIRLANEFHKSGYRVDLIPNRPDSPYLEELRPGVSIKNLPTFHLTSGIPAFAHYLFKQKPAVILTSVYQQAVLPCEQDPFSGSRSGSMPRSAIPTAGNGDRFHRGNGP